MVVTDEFSPTERSLPQLPGMRKLGTLASPANCTDNGAKVQVPEIFSRVFIALSFSGHCEGRTQVAPISRGRGPGSRFPPLIPYAILPAVASASVHQFSGNSDKERNPDSERCTVGIVGTPLGMKDEIVPNQWESLELLYFVLRSFILISASSQVRTKEMASLAVS